MQQLLASTHPEWHLPLTDALSCMDNEYLTWIQENNDWLPGRDNLFAAFSLPLSSTHYLLLGESPYPRAQSANGYAFWDNSVDSLWSENGLSKEVNRATSLRNFIKMLLHARGDLKDNFSQPAIAGLDKKSFVGTGAELFQGLIANGFLLLNASLIYSEGKVNYHARNWLPFMRCLLRSLAEQKPELYVVLLGRIAKMVPEATLFPHLVAEHPFNISFITNPLVLEFFGPLDLLNKYDQNNNSRCSGSG